MYHTILTNCYTTQSGDDPRATGGVTYVEATRTRNGGYRIRHTDSNGQFSSSGRSREASPAEISELLARAQKRAENDERQGRDPRGTGMRAVADLRRKFRLPEGH